MKTLIIFRGKNIRYEPYWSSINLIKNWNKTIFADLKKNNINYDIALVTYESEILDDLKNILNAKYIITEGFHTQIENFNVLSNLMLETHKEYDRFVICRFDYRYRYKITKWPSWNENGIIITSRDPSVNFYSDILFICDSNSIEDWMNATKSITMWPHQLGQYLFVNQIPFHLMYNDAAYGRDLHPLYSAIEEDEPNLKKPISDSKIRRYCC
jgi:hypothetical protein